jgi:hypothetical protein
MHDRFVYKLPFGKKLWNEKKKALKKTELGSGSSRLQNNMEQSTNFQSMEGSPRMNKVSFKLNPIQAKKQLSSIYIRGDDTKIGEISSTNISNIHNKF